ncbi:hypothetical protein ACUS56_32310, partial [Pseudomonas aeruginosa]
AGAKDVPSWAKGDRPYQGESGKDFAKRIMDQKYGKGNWKDGPCSGQPIPDSGLSFSSATAGGNPSLN